MAMSSLRKDYSSLRRQRHTGVVPQNSLASAVQAIQVPTVDTINRGKTSIVKPPAVKQVQRSQDVRTCFFLPIAIQDSGLTEDPLWVVSVKSVDHNGTKVAAEYRKEFELCASKDGEFLFFKTEFAYMDKMVIPRGTLSEASFCDSQCLLLLEKRFGYFWIEFYNDKAPLRDFLRRHAAWVQSPTERLDASTLLSAYAHQVRKRKFAQQDPETVVHTPVILSSPPVISSSPTVTLSSPAKRTQSPESDGILQNGLLSTPQSDRVVLTRQSRSATKLLRDEAAKEDNTVDSERSRTPSIPRPEDAEVVERETPADFDPPLQYTLNNGKKCSIAYNDFKTLYNNDWINDTLIDFFIAYEKDDAINNLNLIGEHDVYALNSFFFTKLLSKPEEQETPDYYGNIRRWLLKVDLMSYEYVIIPVNENSHWYCCVIKGLPQLLDHAKNGGDVNERKLLTEIFVIDSLRQRHPNIAQPLRTVLVEYCKEKHGVNVPPKLIRFFYAQVPRQRNFNDCGIHVIYNIRKWLSEPAICEVVWKKGRKKGGSTYYSATERDNMRQTYIDKLLALHSQFIAKSQLEKEAENAHSDDDIEEISYNPSKSSQEENSGLEENSKVGSKENLAADEGKIPNGENKGGVEESSSETSATPNECFDTDNNGKDSANTFIQSLEPSRRTLDPRALKDELSNAVSPPILQIEHPQIRRLCLKSVLKRHTIDFFNRLLTDHSKIYTEEQQRAIVDFADKFNFFDPSTDRAQCEILANSLIASLAAPPAPMDEPFVIQDPDDSAGELNRSVNDLRISHDIPIHQTHRERNETPEATRRFLKEVEQDSPLRRRTRNGKLSEQSASGYESDVEIVEDQISEGVLAEERLKSSPKKENGEGRSEIKLLPAHEDVQSGSVSSTESDDVVAQKEVVTISDDERISTRVRSPRLKITYLAYSSPKRRRVEESRLRRSYH